MFARSRCEGEDFRARRGCMLYGTGLKSQPSRLRQEDQETSPGNVGRLCLKNRPTREPASHQMNKNQSNQRAAGWGRSVHVEFSGQVSARVLDILKRHRHKVVSHALAPPRQGAARGHRPGARCGGAGAPEGSRDHPRRHGFAEANAGGDNGADQVP